MTTDGGQHLYDSPGICEYLDSLHDGDKLFPAAGAPRWTALRRQALADGILDAAVTWRCETNLRPAEYRWTVWLDRQEQAVVRALDALEDEASTLTETFGIGEIAIACALGYLDFRWQEIAWRQKHPRLATWYATQETRASIVATQPNG